MRAWWPVFAAIALIALGFVGELMVEAAIEEGQRSFSPQVPVMLEAVVRIIGVALMLGMGWLVLSGPRHRLPGLVMVLIGAYLSVVPALSLVSGITMPPLTLEAYQYPLGLLLWIGGAVMVMGLVALIGPSRPDSSIVQQPRRSVDEVEVLPQPR